MFFIKHWHELISCGNQSFHYTGLYRHHWIAWSYKGISDIEMNETNWKISSIFFVLLRAWFCTKCVWYMIKILNKIKIVNNQLTFCWQLYTMKICFGCISVLLYNHTLLPVADLTILPAQFKDVNTILHRLWTLSSVLKTIMILISEILIHTLQQLNKIWV